MKAAFKNIKMKKALKCAWAALKFRHRQQLLIVYCPQKLLHLHKSLFESEFVASACLLHRN